ncbi:MAG: 30S ribosomal protein S11, partial [Patescibacteria group bacterium]
MGKKKIVQKNGEFEKGGGTAGEAVPKSAGHSKQKYENGRIYVQASYNNTLVTVTDEKGNVITWFSAGSLGFSGPKKSTPFAASKVAEAVFQKIQNSGPFNVQIFV